MHKIKKQLKIFNLIFANSTKFMLFKNYCGFHLEKSQKNGELYSS